ncbi:26S proteasome regulatory subunit N10 [Strigomonas culicis]|uniref:26S proteasome regulatory subunit N10 n=1 Tax=Strigomonas culicis TaxID=28005 RepID=S9UG31_9TRYP|nr:26S proteasome regulatory subunit N10 [Strigomonas culicis]|eukprot:EPY27679.1 26S proteasome regulatory subunit N10 [Strigomonas culicis]
MRNGDQFPNRLMAEQNAANMLVNAKVQMNAENSVGFLTLGGTACTVYETLTFDVDRVMASLSNIPITGNKCHFSSGLLIASLALSHRTNPRSEKRIVAFIGSPIVETEKDLETLAKRLRKEDVAVDVVAFGVESNIPLLRTFVAKVNKNDSSRFLCVSDTDNLTSALMSDAIFLGENAFQGGESGGGGGGAAPNMGYAFGVDPNMDPELAMALRMSMEDEMQRQAAAAAATGAAPPVAAPGGQAASAVVAPAPPAMASGLSNEEDMDEDEMLRRALALSLEEAQQTAQTGTQPSGANGAGGNEDESFLKELNDAMTKKNDKDKK